MAIYKNQKLVSFSGENKYQLGCDFSLESGVLELEYRLSGDLNSIVFPANCESPKRLDGLWKETCFECFLLHENRESYTEYNFSPNGNWNAYEFSAYRELIGEQDIKAPRIEFLENSHCRIRALLPSRNYLKAGLSSVLFLSGGNYEYMALSHCGENPDFHLAKSFLLNCQ